MKTGASPSATMANAVTAESTPSIDRKKGRFLGLFCRKTGVRRQLFNTLLCVFTCFWDSWLFQTLAPQGEPARGRLQNKSCLKTYRRFFVRSGMCLNGVVKIEMTGRDEGCERSAALRDAALLSRNYAIARGAHAPSPSQAGGARNSTANRCKRVQSYRNRTATPGEELHQIAPDCTKLHQIAVIAPKNQKGENQSGRKVFCPYLLPPSFCLQSRRGVPPLGGESSAPGRRCHLSRLSYASPSEAVRDIESGWIQPAPIQLNPT